MGCIVYDLAPPLLVRSVAVEGETDGGQVVRCGRHIEDVSCRGVISCGRSCPAPPQMGPTSLRCVQVVYDECVHRADIHEPYHLV